MRYERFDELPVWQLAVQLAVKAFELTSKAKLRPTIRGQLERAALSVSNNIAEGFERGSTQELVNFLYIARGSAGEVRSIVSVIEAMELGASQIPHSRFHRGTAEGVGGDGVAGELKTLAERVSRQLGAWLESLKNSDLKGQRYVNERVRQQDEVDAQRQAPVAQTEDRVARPQRGRLDRGRSGKHPTRTATGDA